MPELPEVETVRRDLEQEIVGKTIINVMVTGHRTVRRHDAGLLPAALINKTVQRMRRLGKFLMADVGDQTLVMHLRMSGQLLWLPDGDAPLLKHTHVRMRFAQGQELRFVDPRTFGEMWVSSSDVPELNHLGPDALNELPSAQELAAKVSYRRSVLKTLLLDQTVVTGIGNIYADEISFRARLRPTRLPGSISKPAYGRLRQAIHETLSEAVERRGSTLSDQQYVDLYGRVGDAQSMHRVHAREGQPCFVCGRDIKRIKIGGRSTYFCSHCQK